MKRSFQNVVKLIKRYKLPLAAKDLLSGYAAILFAAHPAIGFLFLLATFWSPPIGFSGFLSALTALISAKLFRFNHLKGHQHIYNAVLIGLSLGVLFPFNKGLFILLTLSGFLVVWVTVIVVNCFWRFASLPALSLPFVITAIPMHMLAKKYLSSGFSHFSTPTDHSFFSSLGATFFLPHPFVGFLLFLGILGSSYYLALLAILGFLVGSTVFNYFAISAPSYLLEWTGFNLILTSMAIGGIFTIPGRQSFAVALLGSAFAAILIVILEGLFFDYGPLTFVLPFLLSTHCILLALQQRLTMTPPFLTLTHPQLPEESYREYRLIKARRAPHQDSIAIQPPFYGSWHVYQGFYGPHTHKPPWQYALDFIIQNGEQSFKNEGTTLEDYFCFGLPVLAPCHGTVLQVRNDLNDNIPGETNGEHPWGNYVLLQREDGYFVLLAHLKQFSVQVAAGGKIVVGQVIAACGNSGRSMQPHLHLQVQNLGEIGSATRPFHFLGVVSQTSSSPDSEFYPLLCPTTGASVQGVQKNLQIAHYFHFMVGRYYRFRFQEKGGTWVQRSFQVKLDLHGQFRLESDKKGSCAFEECENMLIFKHKQGPRDIFLDILILSLSVTPYTDQACLWKDSPSSQLLPLPLKQRLLLNFIQPLDPGLVSRYRRNWDAHNKYWIQTGEHHRKGLFGIQNTVFTRVEFSPEQPFLRITARLGEKSWLTELLAIGQTADKGIPPWEIDLTNLSSYF